MSDPHPITIAEIQQAVCREFRVGLVEMLARRRSRVVARPRQVAMYLARKLTVSSLPEIGRHFGNRDHTTVLHACQMTTARMVDDPDLGETVRRVLEALLPQDDPNQLPLPLAAAE